MPKVDFQLNLGDTRYDPLDFVEAASFAEEMGFSVAWLGDHLVPWYHTGKRSANVWPVISVALDRTDRIKMGPLVATPIGARYQPAIVAQASATIDNMYPGRFLLGVGTGEAINEAQFLGGRWPDFGERMERLSEGVDLIRRLFESKEPFAFHGRYFSSDFNFLYTKPRKKIPIYFSALGKRGALQAGEHGDHLLTISPRASKQKLKDEILPEYHRGCRKAHRKPGGLAILLVESFQRPEEYREKNENALGWMLRESWGLENPVTVEAKGKDVSLERVKESMHFVRSWRELARIIEEYIEIGATAIILDSKADKKQIRNYADNLLTLF